MVTLVPFSSHLIPIISFHLHFPDNFILNLTDNHLFFIARIVIRSYAFCSV